MTNAFLSAMQERLDAEGCTIKFIDENIKPSSIGDCVNYALQLRHTIKTGLPKKYRKQEVGSTRSLQDMYLICKHYFPNCKIGDVSAELQKIREEKRLHAHFCSTHRKMMFCKTTYPNNYLPYDIDKYGVTVRLNK